MRIDTSELCDIYQDQIDVVEPIFSSFGGRTSFSGKITTIKCFESNGLIEEVLEEDGLGRVLLIDGGGSVRRALIDSDLAQLAVDSVRLWQGQRRFAHDPGLAEQAHGVDGLAATLQQAEQFIAKRQLGQAARALQ